MPLFHFSRADAYMEIFDFIYRFQKIFFFIDIDRSLPRSANAQYGNSHAATGWPRRQNLFLYCHASAPATAYHLLRRAGIGFKFLRYSGLRAQRLQVAFTYSL